MKKIDLQCCGNCARSSYKEQMHTDEIQLECNLLGLVESDMVCKRWAFDGNESSERMISVEVE